jgi:hypothetical protein
MSNNWYWENFESDSDEILYYTTAIKHSPEWLKENGEILSTQIIALMKMAFYLE